MVVAEHSSPAGQSVHVELPGLLERALMVQATCQEMRRAQGVGMVVAEHSVTPGEGVLAELAGLAVRAEVNEDAQEGIGTAQGVLVVCSELLRPLLVEVLGEVTGRVDITSVVQVPAGAAGQVPQVGAGTGGGVGGQQVGQDPRPARPACRVLIITRVGCDQQGLCTGAIGYGVGGGELVAEDGLGQAVQLQPAVNDAGQAVATHPPQTAVRRHRTGHRSAQRLKFRRSVLVGRDTGTSQDVSRDGFRGEERTDPR